ncbi:MAG: hypothetical protein CMI13_11825 [Oleibacter sp.]|nr:hypothetical protein [Thalassolituus sp.]|tara:strand:+ start:396 stop:605 length:210 start_codon:yes stop_codon:yes gene_type:complete
MSANLCAVDGVLGSVHGNRGRKIFGLCPKVKVGGGCGAHGNTKCEHMIKIKPEAAAKPTEIKVIDEYLG